MKIRVVLLIGLLATAFTCAGAQEKPPTFTLRTLAVTGEADFGTGNRTTFLSGSTGLGGVVEARLFLAGMFSLGLEGGYSQYTIKQQHPVTNWNWVYWQKYYRSYINADWLGPNSYFNGTKQKTSLLTDDQVVSGMPIVREDSMYQASMTAVQTMNVLPLGITFTAEFPANSWLVPFAGAGVHAFLYERTMYLDEHWVKRVKPDAGVDSGSTYAFQQDFRNYATPIRGEVYGISGTVGADILVSDLIAIRAAARYTAVIDAAGGKSAAENFPFRGVVAAKLGLVIRY